MSVASNLHSHYSETRARLRCPPNAVRDLGIDLKRKPFVPVIVHINPEPKPAPPPVVVEELVYVPVLPPIRPAELLVVDEIEICGRNPISFHVEILSDPAPIRKPHIIEIIKEVSIYYEMPLKIMLSESRMARHARARQIGMYLCRELTDRSYPYIVRKFRRSDHTTGVHAYQRIADLCLMDSDIAFDVAMIEAQVIHRCRSDYEKFDLRVRR